ncbi:MAG: hypothetical protein PHS49_06475 [Candidatus Gracilibacteria bacterium]|nr:hypothetical protein [Candidatus Gracilibacteria bacterium]
MRKVIVFLIFLIIIFIVNILFYFVSDDYREFLKNLKNKENTTVSLDEKAFNDIPQLEVSDSEKIVPSTKNEEIFTLEDSKGKVELKNEVVLGKNYQDIIDIFSVYNLNKLEINSSLFDITNEYPDNYFEYYSADLTLYLFPTKTYRDLADIFTVLSDELPFTINEVNNFGDNSFFINLNNDIADRFIRIVVSNKGVVFGLKIKITEYDLVKSKLNEGLKK